MLDWYSRKRLIEEQDQRSVPPAIGQVLPDFVLGTPDGGVFSLSDVPGRLALLVLSFEFSPAQTYLLSSFAKKCREVRPEITRVVVVTRPEHLPTVVALGGDMLILADEAGDVVLQLAAKEAMLYFLDDHRLVLNIARLDESLPWFIPRALRPAA